MGSLEVRGVAEGDRESFCKQVALHGGIRPAEPRRSGLALTLAEREVISRGLSNRSAGRKSSMPVGDQGRLEITVAQGADCKCQDECRSRQGGARQRCHGPSVCA